jgi:Raf kinase inhibitor-like YbhB/YbcL family protein
MVDIIRQVGLAVLVVGLMAAGGVRPLRVTSPAFTSGGAIPSKYTCQGEQSSPPLAWSTLPSSAKSIVVLVDDPNAPGGTFEHLVLYNLPATERSLPSQPAQTTAGAGTAALNSNQDAGWAPICPPSGTHHYRFVVLGLDTMLSLPPQASSRDVNQAMHGHIVAQGELQGIYPSSGPLNR